MAITSEDIKRLNAMELLKDMYHDHHGTIAEIASASGFSNSAVRTTLEWLKEKGVLKVQKLDLSTGGRCPRRYAFCQSRFRTLGLFIDDETVDITIRSIAGDDLYQNHVYIKENKELEDFVVMLVDRYAVNCVSVAGAGIIEGLSFYRDVQGVMVEYRITAHLKQRLSIPVVIENDVKAMMMGYQSKQQVELLAYLYISHTGVGSSYYLDSDIWRGSHHFSGEIGLMPYEGHKINEVIQQHPEEALMEKLIQHMIVTISTLIDPQKIVITGKRVPWHCEERIHDVCISYLSEKYPLHLEFRNFPLQDAIDGLHYIAVLKLFEEYTKL